MYITVPLRVQTQRAVTKENNKRIVTDRNSPQALVGM